ncbi:MAG: hypothetical protein RLZZ31_1860 [Actinomycetota bacterium]
MLASQFSGTDAILTIVIVVLLIASIFFAVAEIALTRMTIPKALAAVEEGKFGAKKMLALVTNPSEFLNVVLLVVLVCQLVQATLVGVVANNVFGSLGLALSTAFNVIVVFVIAEAMPKTWAIQHTDRAARLSAPIVYGLVYFWPLRMVSKGLIGLSNVILPGKGIKDGPFITEQEILAMADEAVSADVLEAEERELIGSVIEFGETICREVMVPRPDMLTLSESLTVTEGLENALNGGRSRVPIFGSDIDDITGVVYVKDLIRAFRAGRMNDRLGRFARQPFFVPETKRISELLGEMRARKSHMAIVIDEYGGTSGLVTMEDLLEEIVGEIVDEYDREDSGIEHLPGGAIRFAARLPIDEVSEVLGVELPEGDWDTLGGLIFHLLGHVPFEGETVQWEQFRMKAGQVKGRRIGVVTIDKPIEIELEK